MNIISPIFTTFDRASGAYSPPFIAPAAGVAVRSFRDAILDVDSKTDLSRHPDDFDLFEIGTFNSSTCKLVPYEEPQLIAQGKQIALQPNLPLNG